MIFNQVTYFLLLLVSVVSFFLVPKQLRRLVLIVSGAIFYSYFGGFYVLLVLAEIIMLFWLMQKPTFYKLLPALFLCIGLLAVFKYRIGLRLPLGKMAMPLAISFFTFEFIHVLVDKYRGKIAGLTLTNLTAFIFFFPNLVAGPIKRFNDFIEQIDQAYLDPKNIAIGSYRILSGLLKKLVLADTLAAIRGPLLTTRESVAIMTTSGGWIALMCFAWQIYFDFSGYSDIAIGSARLFGITIPENFHRPYFQTSISAFWQNWHKTLTRWITDYIFIPLGGSRKNFLSVCCNTIVAMAVSGIWHGATYNFFLWGVYHGLLLVIERVYKKIFPVIKLPGLIVPIARGVSIVITFIFVSLGWLLFIAPLDVAVAAFSKMIGASK